MAERMMNLGYESERERENKRHLENKTMKIDEEDRKAIREMEDNIEKSSHYKNAMEHKFKACDLYKLVSQKLNLRRVKEYAQEVLNIAKELRVLEELLTKNPDRVPSYRMVLIPLIKKGERHLKKIYNILKEASVFELLDMLIEYRLELIKSGEKNNLPTSESEFLKRLGFSVDEQSLLVNIYECHKKHREPSLVILLGEYIQDLLVGPIPHSEKDLLRIVTSVSQLCAGLGLLALNVGSYVLAPEVVISYHDMAVSCFTGLAYTARGIDKVWLDKHTKEPPTVEKSNGMIKLPE